MSALSSSIAQAHGSLLEIYSRTSETWFPGWVTSPIEDDRAKLMASDFITVEFQILNGVLAQKRVRPTSGDLRWLKEDVWDSGGGREIYELAREVVVYLYSIRIKFGKDKSEGKALPYVVAKCFGDLPESVARAVFPSNVSPWTKPGFPRTFGEYVQALTEVWKNPLLSYGMNKHYEYLDPDDPENKYYEFLADSQPWLRGLWSFVDSNGKHEDLKLLQPNKIRAACDQQAEIDQLEETGHYKEKYASHFDECNAKRRWSTADRPVTKQSMMVCFGLEVQTRQSCCDERYLRLSLAYLALCTDRLELTVLIQSFRSLHGLMSEFVPLAALRTR